ncbi:hypothetical protein BHE74_00025495 [Ensete ventricosum]|nr:hypothetical protein BHE74_00025495 [Ensete ventricosum]
MLTRRRVGRTLDLTSIDTPGEVTVYEGEGSKSHPSKDKEQVGPASETRAPRPRRPRSVKELSRTSAGEEDMGYYTLRMTNLLLSEHDTPLEARWSMLKQGTKIWVNEAASGEYARGVLIPRLAVDLYSSSSEPLVDRALKSTVLGLKREIVDLRVRLGPEAVVVAEQRASEAQALVDHLKVEFKEADRHRVSLETERENYCHDLVGRRALDDELLKLMGTLENLRVELPTKTIIKYKKSTGFEMGLV